MSILKREEILMYFSVITPTYNRGYILEECYKSLLLQTFKDFEWIVVDDGSDDCTRELVSSFIKENKINIKYLYQKNAGKHRAHNTAVTEAQSTLTVCVDSDDRLTEDALEKAYKLWDSRKEQNTAGIIARRGRIKDGCAVCSDMPKGINTCTMFELVHKYKFEGDTVLFFKTDILKQNMFKEFEGENFLTETSMYFKIDKIAPMILSNEIIYLCEYLHDGLTAKYFELLSKNPKGSAYTYYQYYLSSYSILLKMKFAIITNAYLKCVSGDKLHDIIKRDVLITLTAPLGTVYKIKKLDIIRR